MKKQFNPHDWLNKAPVNPSVPQSISPSDIFSEVDTIITRIESAHTDITSDYANWVSLGFAFANEFGEAGRSFFQRVSRFYPCFSLTACDKQYDRCLKSHGHGITIKTFFHLAKEAGIDVRTGNPRGRWDDGAMGRKHEGEMVRGGEGETDSGQSQWSDGVASSTPFASSPPRPISPSSSKDSVQSQCSESAASVDRFAPFSLELPTLPDSLFPTLPDFLQRIVAMSTSREERDLLLLGSLATLSSCLHKVYGIYDDKKVFPNLYLYVTAKASAGKGRLVLCKQLVQLVHWSLRDQAHAIKQRYEMEIREFNLIKGKDISIEKPEKPPEKLLFIPANSSSTGVFQLLSDNDGRGLIFETEGDTLAQAFKTDYGNYSDGFRKAFHHETINYYRRTDREYVEIRFPCLSAVLSGTPKQISTLIPNAENGLFSRFIFYYMNIKPVWKDVFARKSDRSLDEHFSELGKDFFSLYNALDKNPEIAFCLTPCQQEAFNAFFTQVQEKYLLLQGMDYMATIRRLGLIAFRIAMILSVLRLMETGDLSAKTECLDMDFEAALSIVRVLVRHASHVYSELPEEVKVTRPKDKKELFLEGLPERFTRKEFLQLAKSLDFNERMADRCIAAFCEKGLILKEEHGVYRRLGLSGPGEEMDCAMV